MIICFQGGHGKRRKVQAGQIYAKSQGFCKHSVEKLGSQCDRRIEGGTF